MSKAPRWTEEQLQEHLGRSQGQVQASPPKPHKYSAKPTEIDGIRFDSQLEARYYQLLQFQIHGGAIAGILRQVPFHLPGRTRLVIDFAIIENDGRIWFADTKGFETEAFKIKLRQVRELYPWAEIHVIKKVKP